MALATVRSFDVCPEITPNKMLMHSCYKLPGKIVDFCGISLRVSFFVVYGF